MVRLQTREINSRDLLIYGNELWRILNLNHDCSSLRDVAWPEYFSAFTIYCKCNALFADLKCTSSLVRVHLGYAKGCKVPEQVKLCPFMHFCSSLFLQLVHLLVHTNRVWPVWIEVPMYYLLIFTMTNIAINIWRLYTASINVVCTHWFLLEYRTAQECWLCQAWYQVQLILSAWTWSKSLEDPSPSGAYKKAS